MDKKYRSTFSPISKANMGHASFRDVARATPTTVKTSKNWRFPNHNSPQQFNKQQYTNPLCAVWAQNRSWSVCFIIIVPDCSILHICIYFELPIKKYNILKKQTSHPVQSSLISSDRISTTLFNTGGKTLPMV